MPIIQQPAFEIANLNSTLASQAQQVGEPVSVRVHLSVADSQAKWTEVAQAAVSVVGVVFDVAGFTWRIRRSNSHRLLNLLGQNEAGKTTLITLARGFEQTIAVTLFGNHGTAKFDEAACSIENGAFEALPESLNRLLVNAAG
jgi:hypothetical protein